MNPSRISALAAAISVAVLPSCARRAEDKPAREAVLALLQKEAESLKAEGEKMNPAIGVKSVWRVEAVDVREQPNDPARPWLGRIRFRIESGMREVDGSLLTQSSEKTFDYAYDAATKRWLFHYPSRPAP